MNKTDRIVSMFLKTASKGAIVIDGADMKEIQLSSTDKKGNLKKISAALSALSSVFTRKV